MRAIRRAITALPQNPCNRWLVLERALDLVLVDATKRARIARSLPGALAIARSLTPLVESICQSVATAPVEGSKRGEGGEPVEYAEYEMTPAAMIEFLSELRGEQ